MQTDYTFTSRRSPVIGRRGMVATTQPLAVAAGLEILAQGGTAAEDVVPQQTAAACLHNPQSRPLACQGRLSADPDMRPCGPDAAVRRVSKGVPRPSTCCLPHRRAASAGTNGVGEPAPSTGAGCGGRRAVETRAALPRARAQLHLSECRRIRFAAGPLRNRGSLRRRPRPDPVVGSD